MGQRRLQHPDAARAELEGKPRPPPPPLRAVWHVTLTRHDGPSEYRGKESSYDAALERARSLWGDAVYSGAWLRQAWE